MSERQVARDILAENRGDQSGTSVDAATDMLRNLEASTAVQTASSSTNLANTDMSNREQHAGVALAKIPSIVDLAFQLQLEKQELALITGDNKIAARVKQRMQELGDKTQGRVSHQAMIEHLGQMGIDSDIATRAVQSRGYVAKYEAKRQSLAREVGLPDDAIPRQIKYEQYLREKVNENLPLIKSSLDKISANPVLFREQRMRFIDLNLNIESCATAFKGAFYQDEINFSKPTSPALIELKQRARELGGEILFKPLYNMSFKIHSIEVILKLGKLGVNTANNLHQNLEAGAGIQTADSPINMATTISNIGQYTSVAIAEIERIVDLAFQLQHEKQEQAQQTREKEKANAVKQRMEELAGTSQGIVSYQKMIENLEQMGIDTDIATRAVESTDYVEKYEEKRQNLARGLGLPEDASLEQINYEQKWRKNVDEILPLIEWALDQIASNPLEHQHQGMDLMNLPLSKERNNFERSFNPAFLFYFVPFIGQLALAMHNPYFIKMFNIDYSKPSSPALKELIQKTHNLGGEILIIPTYTGFWKNLLCGMDIVIKLRS